MNKFFSKKNLGIQCFDLNRKIDKRKKKVVIKVNQSKYKKKFFKKKFINFDGLKNYGRFNKIASVINSIN